MKSIKLTILVYVKKSPTIFPMASKHYHHQSKARRTCGNKQYSAAGTRLTSTGEGQLDNDRLWNSIRLSWLNKICPYFEAIGDIIRSDRSYTPYFVS
jgi:hypothetical protein